MYWVVIDGVRLPRRIAGDVALDFCNTLAGWNEPARKRGDWLDDYERMVRWAEYAGLVSDDDGARLRRTAKRRPADADAELRRGRVLRQALQRAVTHPDDVRALLTVSRFARESAAQGGLVPDGDGTRWQLRRSAGLAQPVLAVARAAESFLTNANLAEVKACPGAVCGWLFVDRTGRRRWCSMADCGNRAKQAAFAARHR